MFPYVVPSSRWGWLQRVQWAMGVVSKFETPRVLARNQDFLFVNMTFFYVYPHVPQSNPHVYNPYKIPIESLSLIIKSNKSSLDGEPTPRSEPHQGSSRRSSGKDFCRGYCWDLGNPVGNSHHHEKASKNSFGIQWEYHEIKLGYSGKNLLGGFNWKKWVSQLGWWHSQWKFIKNVPNQQPEMGREQTLHWRLTTPQGQIGLVSLGESESQLGFWTQNNAAFGGYCMTYYNYLDHPNNPEK